MPEKIQGSLQLKKGESYDLQLKGKATSGYEWVCTIENEKIVARCGSRNRSRRPGQCRGHRRQRQRGVLQIRNG
jgi:predicted secreted protein